MATRGRPRKTPVEIPKLRCGNCGQELKEDEFYKTSSRFYGRLPLCKNCLESMFFYYNNLYSAENHNIPEKDAIRRICMALDIFYSDDLYDSAKKNLESQGSMSLIASYIKNSRLNPYNKRTYDNTIKNEGHMTFTEAVDEEKRKFVTPETKDFFGKGLVDDDYIFLKKQYDDWTARHECNTKAQEEIFKRLCFKQLELLKASRIGEDTKDLDASFQKLLESAKLQPRQNSSESTSDSQSFGTLIEKWENTRPLPDIDDDLKDVDKIGLYLDVFFRGHLAKMMGLKNGLSNLYDKFIKKYTVEKPEYDDSSDGEALFDAIFGNQELD